MYVLIVSLVLSVTCFAAEDLKAKEVIAEKARSRSYDGGIDEQPIVVQKNLAEPRTDGSEYSLRSKVLNAPPEEESITDETTGGF